MTILPPFLDDGTLPPGEYPLTLDQLRDSMLVLGPGDPKDHPAWDAPWRSHLVDQLAVLAGQLWQTNVDQIYIDGSFVEDKDHPNDIDASP